MARHLGHLGGGCAVLVVCLAVTLSSGCGGHTQPYQGSGNPSINEVLEPVADINIAADPITQAPTYLGTPSDPIPPVPTPPDTFLTPWHNFLHSPHYSGSIAVMFKEGSGVRLRDGKWAIVSPPHPDPLPQGGEDQGEGAVSAVEMIGVPQSFSPELESLNSAVSSRGAIIHRGMDIEEETMEAALAKAAREGKKLHDWNLYYTIEIENPNAAEKLWNVLSKSSVVAWTHPIPKMYPLGGLGPTPDLTSKQGYLDSEQATGGLNIYPAWNKGISGQGIIIADIEINWNLDHEDLPIDQADVNENWGYIPNHGGNDAIQHGAAVVGILAGLDNASGIKGIAHSSDIELMQIAQADEYMFMGILRELLEGYVGKVTGKFKPGDIVLVEVANPGEKTPVATGCAVDNNTKEPTYCLPMEAYSLASIGDVTTLGGIVVEAAANGGVDLGDPNARPTLCSPNKPCPDLAVDDSGAIMVAASNGGKDNTKPWWSNWGKRINAYAWGYGVTTTGYGVDYDANWQPIPNADSDPNDPNRWYTNSFNGTSSATALVAGAVALVQSYTREYYRHTSAYDPMLADIITHKQVYLDAWQIRELIKLAGVSCDPNYNIGYKPDVGKMFQLIEQGVVIPHVAPDNAALIAPAYAVAGVRYDMDGDKRAELISWTPAFAGAGSLWKIDLSTIAPNIANPNPDNYGEWDLRIEFQMDDAIDSGIFFPVVHDYDSDGDADLSIYDSRNGKWYIRYMTPAIVAKAGNGTIALAWDVVIDYSADPMWRSHARPLPGDYNGDNFLDTAIVRADGHWVIDYGGIGRLVRNGGSVIEYKTDFRGFEKDVTFLTPQQLADAPGWGYTAAVSNLNETPPRSLLFKIPDGLADSGKLGISFYPNFTSSMLNLPPVYGRNDDIVLMISGFLSVKRIDGTWEMALDDSDQGTLTVLPYGNFGGVDCYPVPANYSGGATDDATAVKCGSEWRFPFFNPNGYIFRMVEMNDDPMSLPPTISPGGIKYQDMKSILNYYGLFNAYVDKDPFTPYTAQCIKLWGVSPEYCLAPR